MSANRRGVMARSSMPTGRGGMKPFTASPGVREPFGECRDLSSDSLPWRAAKPTGHLAERETSMQKAMRLPTLNATNRGHASRDGRASRRRTRQRHAAAIIRTAAIIAAAVSTHSPGRPDRRSHQAASPATARRAAAAYEVGTNRTSPSLQLSSCPSWDSIRGVLVARQRQCGVGSRSRDKDMVAPTAPSSFRHLAGG